MLKSGAWHQWEWSNGEGAMNVCVCALMNTILAFIACNIRSCFKQPIHQVHCFNNTQTIVLIYYFKFKSSSDQEFKRHSSKKMWVCSLFTILHSFETKEFIKRKADHGEQIVLWRPNENNVITTKASLPCTHRQQ